MYKIRLGHKLTGGTTHELPSTVFIVSEDESKGFRLSMSPEGELVVTKFNHDDSREAINIRPNTANQVTIS